MKKNTVKKLMTLGSTLVMVALLGACAKTTEENKAKKTGSESETKAEVVIYTNADEEPVEVIKGTLDNNGFAGQYVIQSFGTSELGGKLLAEGKNIEADLVTMSTFYLDGAQAKNKFLKNLALEVTPLQAISEYAAPLTTQEGVIFYNTKVLEGEKLTVPKSLKDLADAKYAGQIAIPDINHSSTAWLLFQGLIDAYGEKEAKTILKGIYKNAENHLEQSGSGPLKKARVGEVAIGFGLRHQAVTAKNEGEPIDYVEPAEGTFSLTESLAVIDKGQKTNPLAEKMLNIILQKGRHEIIKSYPSPLYEGESVKGLETAKHQKVFGEMLTPELLESHKKIVE